MSDRVLKAMLLTVAAVATFSFAQEELREECYSPPLPNSDCGFYVDCLEQYFPCGSSGYAIGYGFKYCQRFTSETTSQCMDSAGHDWVNSTLTCLEQALVPIIESEINDISCQSIKLDAFDSHPICYTGGGGSIPTSSSICFLPPSDVKCILSTIDNEDLFSPLGLKEDIETARICISQLNNTGFCDDTRNSEICEFWNDSSIRQNLL